jgi:hypothetical protein
MEDARLPSAGTAARKVLDALQALSALRAELLEIHARLEYLRLMLRLRARGPR